MLVQIHRTQWEVSVGTTPPRVVLAKASQVTNTCPVTGFWEIPEEIGEMEREGLGLVVPFLFVNSQRQLLNRLSKNWLL